eukprot:gene58253-biopygen113480
MGIIDGGGEWKSRFVGDAKAALQQHGIMVTAEPKVDPAKADAFHNNVAVTYIDTVREHLRDRFASSGLVSELFSLFEHTRVPSVDSDEHGTYGDAQLAKLLEHYGAPAEAVVDRDSKGKVIPAVYAAAPLGDASSRRRRAGRKVDPAECRRQWPGYRSMVAEQSALGTFTDAETEKPFTFQMFLKWYMKGPYSVVYPCITELLVIAATLPVGSASAERSFSQMKLIKNRLRNRMHGDTLESLMLIAMEGPSELSAELVEECVKEFCSVPRKILC